MEGLRTLALCHFTEEDQAGGVGEEVTADHVGSPERLEGGSALEI